MHDYLHTYDKYKNEFSWDPEKELAKIRDEENWPTPEELQAQVVMHRQEANRLE
jgi:hypothetical protein